MDEFGILALPIGVLYIALIGLSVYMCVLSIKLARRGIKALDIYISKNQ